MVGFVDLMARSNSQGLLDNVGSLFEIGLLNSVGSLLCIGLFLQSLARFYCMGFASFPWLALELWFARLIYGSRNGFGLLLQVGSLDTSGLLLNFGSHEYFIGLLSRFGSLFRNGFLLPHSSLH